MRFRVWNAFASNNSGSYTIVGRFSTDEIALSVVAELSALMRAHTEWLEAESAKNKWPLDGESPLHAFVKKHDLTWHDNMGTSDDWPEHNKDNVPQVFAVGHKVVIHHDYTVTMPRVLGEYFFTRGGRVEHEMDHAHHPIVGVCEMWVPWKERDGVDIPAKVRSIVEALNAEDGPLIAQVPAWHQPAWQSKEGFGEADLTVGAIFDDLLLGFSAIQRIAVAHGLRTNVKLFEAFGAGDPLPFLRPSWPQLAARSCSVVLESSGADVKALSNVVRQLVNYDAAAANKIMQSMPVTVLSGLVAVRAEKVAALLREVGATVTVKTEPREV